MSGWRDIKKAARAVVHETFMVPAVYLTHMTGVPRRVNVRVHSKIATNENEFTWPGTSGYVEMNPRVTFNATEVPEVLGKSLVILSATEMYRVVLAEPNREGFVASQCEALRPDECNAVLVALGPVTGETWQEILP